MKPCELVDHADRFDPGRPPLDVAEDLLAALRKRRTVREFSDRAVDELVIRRLVEIAGTAPSGANMQPWTFVAVSDHDTKRKIRLAAEEEERAFYAGRATDEWLEALAPLGTDPDKGFLETVPWLVVVFRHTRLPDGRNNYYSQESVGLAVGMFLAAAHLCGLATLTHTPAPMKFLHQVLGRPAWERPYMLIPVGYPADDCRVPKAALNKKPLDEILEIV